MAKDKVQGVGIQPAVTNRPDLNQVEAQKVKDVHGKRVTAQDAARLASQAGFQRTGAKKKGLDIGDSSRAPIPLPGDDVDTEAWEQERLGTAQENLTMAGAQFTEIANGGVEEASLGASVVGSSFLPTEGGVAHLQGLADREPPPPVELDDVTTDVKRLFNIELGDNVPVGHKVLATGLVVAGEAGSVRVEQGGINEQELAGGLQKVTERGNQAVGEAQKMSKGINEKLNVQRTFVFKR